MYKAYDTLSDGLKSTLGNLRARHSSVHVFGAARAEKGNDDTVGRIKNPEAATQEAIHPVVIIHPETGRKSLYVNPGFTLGSKVGAMKSQNHYWSISMHTLLVLNLHAAFSGKKVLLLFGIIGPLGIWRSTTIREVVV